MPSPAHTIDDFQLDLLGVPVSTAAEAPAPRKRSLAGQPLMLPTGRLYEDLDNPRTEIPEAELAELVENIRQHGILQPIVVHPADDRDRYKIHFGAKRWRAATLLSLGLVPVVFREGPANPYAQVSENQKRHGLTPMDLARFIRGRVDAGESNSFVAKTLGMDLTTVAHHLALLNLPPVLDATMASGRCTSPRTLYELSKLHDQQPDGVAELVAGTHAITREAVAELRDASAAPERSGPARLKVTCSVGVAQMLARVAGQCDRLDAALMRLGKADRSSLSADDLAALRLRIAQLLRHIDG